MDERTDPGLFDKANIDRRDSSADHHRPSDVNQLVPNFHDFLNLPVKYNPEKYVYPLISSSYANTKVQGNVNKQFNHHKDYVVTTYKPTVSPTYYYTTKANYLKSTQKKDYYYQDYPKTPSITTTTTTTTETTLSVDNIYLTTTKTPNLMDSAMGLNNPYKESTSTPETYTKYTSKDPNNIYFTTKVSTKPTKRPMSIFEQLFGDYEDTEPTETPKPPTPTPSQFNNPPPKYEDNLNSNKQEKPEPNVLTGSQMGQESVYEYEDYEEGNVDDNFAVENKPTEITIKPTKAENISENTVIFVHPTNEVTTPTTTIQSTKSTTTTTTTPTTTIDYHQKTTTHGTTPKVTSLPLGENHVSRKPQPTVLGIPDLREKLNNEKVHHNPFDFSNPTMQLAPSTSNIHIAHDQDTVSFVVGHHQSVDGGKYVGTATQEVVQQDNRFRPLYNQKVQTGVGYTVDPKPEGVFSGSSVTIQPLMNSEASLAIGVPVSGVKKVPGQVMDEKLEINNDFPKGNGPKIVFPDDKPSAYTPDLLPPPKQRIPPNREVLKLSSKPMYHQLPSDLTPPNEMDTSGPPRMERPRPPWDPRPGHFHSGRPEYVRPPRPPPGELAYKRIDNLPNILPQFRPNAKVPPGAPYHFDNPNKGYVRQPLLERPSNRPTGFYEKLQPPPPPSKHALNLRKIPALEKDTKGKVAQTEEKIRGEANNMKKPLQNDQFPFFQTPPKVILPNRRSGNEEPEIETLQMIQAKQAEKQEVTKETTFAAETDITDKPLYVVYPVNSALKLDAIDTTKKETVVIGTRAELPLPPSKINNNKDFPYEENPILSPKDRHDSPILKPHSKPTNFPSKPDFPYPLERPDPSVLNPPVPETPTSNGNALDVPDAKYDRLNQWSSMETEARIVNSKINTQSSNQISATLKTYTERPIAVAYTPTETYDNKNTEKYSMPNYAGPVIPEIRPGSVSNVEIGAGKPDSEFTLSAVMHTRPRPDFNTHFAHKMDTNSNPEPAIPAQDFQAPFQASVNVDSSVSHGWSVVRDKSRSGSEPESEATTIPLATTSEFDIENFKPQLIGGFVPIYSYPESSKDKESEVNERQEKNI